MHRIWSKVPSFYIFLSALISCAHGVLAQVAPAFPQFVDKTAALAPGVPGLVDSYVAWGDYDNDNDLDFIIAGYLYPSFSPMSQIWRNGTTGAAGPFTNQTSIVAPGLPQLDQAHFVWGDYDNDNDLDVLLTGNIDDDTPGICQIWINDISNSGKFVQAITNLPDVDYVNTSWNDYDNDGDLDIILTGGDIGTDNFITQIWRNDGHNVFADTHANLPGLAFYPSMEFGDYDNDGDLDLALYGLTQVTGNLLRIADIWRNDNGSFTALNTGLTPLNGGSIDWGDYDSDGDLDILLTGFDSNDEISEIWQNNNGTFINAEAGLAPMGVNSQWADFDNDGDLDVLLSGDQGSASSRLQIWKNTSGIFSSTNLYARDYGFGSCADVDNDHDLDILLAGDPQSILYQNESTVSNAPPGKAVSLTSQVVATSVILNWSAANDDHTPAAALTYNVRVGTTSGGTDIVSPQANISTGHRYLTEKGNAQLRKNFLLIGLKPGKYYWSVQAIDNNYEGGAFASEQSFTIISNDPDISLPTIVSKTPLNGASNVNPATTLQLRFSENIVLNSGSLHIFNSSTNLLITTISLTSSNTIITGTQVTITPTSLLPSSTGLYIKIDNGSFKDLAGNVFAGISDKSWSFSIAVNTDKTSPLIISKLPTNNTSQVNPASQLIINFNEPIVLVPGQIKAIYYADGFTTIQGIELTTLNTLVEGKKVTITPDKPLPSGVKVSMWIDKGIFKDLSGNFFAGINDLGSWTFTTAASPDVSAPLIMETIPTSGAIDVDQETKLTLKFNEYVVLQGGLITIIQETSNKKIMSFDLNTSNTVVEKSTATISLPENLSYDLTVFVKIAPNVFTYTVGNSFSGIADKRWKFSTQKLITAVEDNHVRDELKIVEEGDQIRILMGNSGIAIRVISDVMGRSIYFTQSENEITLKKPQGLFILHGKKGKSPYAFKLCLKR